MKTKLQASKALFVMLTLLSILPGCGKNNNNGTNVGVSGIGSPIGSGQCATLSGSSAQTITFSGQLSPYSTGLVGNLPSYGYGSYTGGYGSNYWRANTSGDRIDVYVSGNNAYAVVQLSALTVQAITGYSGYNYGGYQTGSSSVAVCGLSINATIFASPSAYGTFGGGQIAMWSNNGQWVRNAFSGSTLLL